MAKLRTKKAHKEDPNQDRIYIYFNCPGCQSTHGIAYPLWNWNQSLDFPTIAPSIKVFGIKSCHLNITNGKIQYHDDCEHELAGKLIDMVEWDGIWFSDGIKEKDL